MSKNKKIWLISIVIAVVLATACIVIAAISTQSEKGKETITFKLTVRADSYSEIHEITTDKKYLVQALREEKMIKCEDGQYGCLINEVCSIKAQGGRYFCILRGGEELSQSADSIEITDGDSIELKLV